MTSDDQAPGTGATTRRARRARHRAAEASFAPTLPFSDTASDTSDAAILGETDSSEAAEAASEAAGTAPDSPESGLDAAHTNPTTVQDVTAPESAPESERAEASFDDELLALQLDADDDATGDDADERQAEWADADRPATALTWLETADVEDSTRPADLNAVTMTDSGPDLLADARRTPALLTARWLAPLGTLAAFAIAYGVTMLLWPLHALPPVVQSVEFTTAPSEVAEIPWPAAGSAGVSIAGMSSAASTADAASIASVTKVVSSLMVLDRMPLQLGEQGPEYSFTYGDSVDYWDYRRANQSALDVPVGGVLTEYQLLQGTLLGSANNYIDYLARDIWGSDEQFAKAAAVWLADRGLSDIQIVTPSGFDERNIASPEALLRLAERAMKNPVFAEIVGSTGAEIPGAGYVENTNGMLADPGVKGIKTGTLVGWCLLTAKDVTIGDTTVQVYAAVLNQANDDERLAVTRSLFSQVETALQAVAPAVPEGTVVGEVSTAWGANVDIVSAADATVLLWNGASATAGVEFALDDKRADGDDVGTLTVNGPVDAKTVDVSLADELAGPSPWWRLTHPLELLGVNAQ